MPINQAAATRPVMVRCASCGTVNRVDLARLANRPRCASCGEAIPFDHPHRVTDRDFSQLVEGASVPVLVDFYADWCGPCRAMAPTLAAFAASRAGEVLVLQLDTDLNPQTAARFGIRGIPTLIAFRGGREVGRHVGMADRQVLESLVV